MIDAGKRHSSEGPNETELKMSMCMIGNYITGKLVQVLDMQMTTIADVQAGDLVIEIDLQVSIASFRPPRVPHQVYICCWFVLLASRAVRVLT
jgi:hypothetical protein